MSTDINKDGKVTWLEAFPYWFDKLRIFPRAFITMYIYLVWRVTEWFMALPEPSMPQAGLVSVVVGAGAAWFGLYVNSKSGNVEVPRQASVSMNTNQTTTTKKDSPVIMPPSDNSEG